MVEAVNLIVTGSAPRIIQSNEEATYDPMLNKKELQKIDWTKSAEGVHNFIRGVDSTPGAWTIINDQEVRLYGSTLWNSEKPQGDAVNVDGRPGIIHDEGLLIVAADGKFVNIDKLKIGNKTIHATRFGKTDDTSVSVEFSQEELVHVELMRLMWKNILNVDIEDSTDFFACGKLAISTFYEIKI